MENEECSLNSFFEEYPNFGFIYKIINEYGGKVFDKGLLKIHTFEYVKTWTKRMKDDYFKNELKEQNLQDIICFASNWQGCMYCVNGENNTIVYFDPATCEFFKADGISINDLFDDVLVDGEYDIIAEDYFKELCDYLKFDNLKYEDSFGHKQYLHLGGEDDVENYEIVNTEVLWELQIQVSRRINEIG